MALPQLIAEIDFTGNPTASYSDVASNADNVISYWRMNNGTALTDQYGTNSGTLFGSPGTVTGGLPYDTDKALAFNGTSGYGKVPSSSSLLQSGAWTYEGWLKVSALPAATSPIWTKGSHGLSLRADGKLETFIANHVSGTVTSTTVTGAVPITTGTYFHVASVYDGANMNLYVNGIPEASSQHTVGTELWGLPVLFSAAHSGTVPAFGSFSTSFGGGTSLSIPAPASISAGNLLLAHINGNSGTVSFPAGWTLLSSDTSSGDGRKASVYYKVADTGDTTAGTYLFTLNQNFFAHGAISRFTGVDTTQPFANPPYTNSDTSGGTAHYSGTVLPACEDVLAVEFVSGNLNNTWTCADGTEQYDTDGLGGINAAMSMYTSNWGTIAPRTFTVTSSLSYGFNQTVHLATVLLKGPDAQNFTAGTLDDWVFWDKALSAGEISSHYQSRLGGVGAWVDVSTDCRGLSTKMGRNYELNRIEAGTAATNLKNQHRKYDPANSSSVYYPNVVPNRKIRFRALYNSVYYPIFQGLVERWPSQWQTPNYDEVALTIVDGFKALAKAGVAVTLPSEQSGAQIQTILNRALWPISDRSLDDGIYTMAQETAVTTAFAKDVIGEIADSELGVFFIDRDGIATFHDADRRWSDSRSITSQAVFSDTGTGIRYMDLVPSKDDDNVVNQWNVTTASGITRSAVDALSVSKNFPTTQDRTTRLDNPGDAALQASQLLQETSNPQYRFDVLRVRLVSQSAAATVQTVLGLRISDRVTVSRNPVPSAGGSTISADYFIEGIEWQIIPGVWDVSFQLSPVATSSYKDTVLLDGPVSYWRFDTVT